jgi:hypothetical protein
MYYKLLHLELIISNIWLVFMEYFTNIMIQYAILIMFLDKKLVNYQISKLLYQIFNIGYLI